MTGNPIWRQIAPSLVVVSAMTGIGLASHNGIRSEQPNYCVWLVLVGLPTCELFQPRARVLRAPRGAQTITDYRPLIRAITSLPGWSGTPQAPHRPVRHLSSVPMSELISADGKILWPATIANDTKLTPARGAAEESVSLVAREQATYGQATIRHVVDARNKLTEVARQSLPSLKARDRNAASQARAFHRGVAKGSCVHDGSLLTLRGSQVRLFPRQIRLLARNSRQTLCRTYVAPDAQEKRFEAFSRLRITARPFPTYV